MHRVLYIHSVPQHIKFSFNGSLWIETWKLSIHFFVSQARCFSSILKVSILFAWTMEMGVARSYLEADIIKSFAERLVKIHCMGELEALSASRWPSQIGISNIQLRRKELIKMMCPTKSNESLVANRPQGLSQWFFGTDQMPESTVSNGSFFDSVKVAGAIQEPSDEASQRPTLELKTIQLWIKYDAIINLVFQIFGNSCNKQNVWWCTYPRILFTHSIHLSSPTLWYATVMIQWAKNNKSHMQCVLVI